MGRKGMQSLKMLFTYEKYIEVAGKNSFPSTYFIIATLSNMTSSIAAADDNDVTYEQETPGENAFL